MGRAWTSRRLGRSRPRRWRRWWGTWPEGDKDGQDQGDGGDGGETDQHRGKQPHRHHILHPDCHIFYKRVDLKIICSEVDLFFYFNSKFKFKFKRFSIFTLCSSATSKLSPSSRAAGSETITLSIKGWTRKTIFWGGSVLLRPKGRLPRKKSA